MMVYGSIAGVGNHVSRLILGGLFFSDDERDMTVTLLDRFVAAGGNTIDTAHGYGRGASERQLGDWLAATGGRDQLTIVTKGAHPYPPDEPYRVTPAHIERDLTESLERLRIDTVDIYLLHRDDERVSVATIIDGLTRHQREGRIRAIGASNWRTERIQEANVYATRRGLIGFAGNSPNLALAIPSEPTWPGCLTIAGDSAALAWHRRHQFPALCWSSQARGFFSGRFAPDRTDDEAMVRVYYTADNWQRLERARALATRLDCTPTQVALAWVLCQPFPTFALIGPRSREELDDCLGATDITLSPDDLAWLNLEQ